MCGITGFIDLWSTSQARDCAARAETLCPDGNFVPGDSCMLSFDGSQFRLLTWNDAAHLE